MPNGNGSGVAVGVSLALIVAAGAGVAAVLYFRQKRRDEPAQVSPEAAPAKEATRKMSLAEALTHLGGKALAEGTKRLLLGPQGYAASVAGRVQKDAA